MMKDRLIKEQLLGYYIRKLWYPQLEVDILSKKRISKTRKLVTDVDVLALYTDITGYFRLILGDCKTLKNQSPITRTLWMKGLMAYLDADKGFIVLTKSIEKEHQLTSSMMGVQLLSDLDFEVYSKGTADYISDLRSALADINNWERHLGISNSFPKLYPFKEFAQSIFWNEQNSTYQLRSAIYLLRKSKGEVNPDNNMHLNVVLNHISLVSIALNNIIMQIFNQYLVPNAKDDLDEDLKIIIYGGIENYDFLNDLRKSYSGEGEKAKDLTLPEWNMFIELVRQILEHPLSFANVALLLKELAFTFIVDNLQQYNYAQELVRQNSYSVTFAASLIKYLCTATMIPKDFARIYTDTIYGLLV